VLNIPITFERDRWNLPQDWTPRNSDDKFDGQELSLKKALANSVNFVTAFVMKKFGPQAVIDLVRKMGITSPIDPFPAICLGSPDISVYEMVAANSTFANKGVYIEPIVITRIEDKNGNVLEEFVPKTNEVMDESTAYAMLSLMEGVVQSGTGVRLRFKYKINTPIAGKTGTTQNQSDGWFMGLTPDLVTGVWTGCEDRAAHFRGIFHGQGASMALPIWGIYMNKVYADSTLAISKGQFERPLGPLTVELDCAKFDRVNKRKGDGFLSDPNQFE
jgi:penicillin-binding protein 1A